MHIREATSSDLDTIARLHTDSWRLTYRGMLSDAYLDGDLLAERTALWQQRFELPQANQRIVLAEIDGTVVGLACAFGDHDEHWGTLLENLHVAPGHKGSGIGAQLVKHIAQWSSQSCAARALHLWVLGPNTAAQGFYQRLGASAVEQLECDGPDGNRVSELRFAWPDLRTLLQAAP